MSRIQKSAEEKRKRVTPTGKRIATRRSRKVGAKETESMLRLALSRQTEKLEQSFRSVYDRMTQLEEEMDLQAHLGLMDLEKNWNVLIKKISKYLSPIKGAALQVRRSGDETKVQAHLLRLDANDHVQAALNKMRHIVEKLDQIRPLVHEEARDIFEHLTQGYERIRDRFGRFDLH